MEVVKVLFGSMLYGTNTPESDTDIKGVYVPNSRDILLGKVQKSARHKTKHDREEQVAGKISRNLPSDVDSEMLALQHFFTMLEEGQMMALDMLFAVEQNLINSSWVWEQIQKNRHRLVSKQIRESIRYMNTQSKKYGVKGSRVAECRDLINLFKIAMEVNPHQKVALYGDFVKDAIKDWDHTKIVRIKTPNNIYLEHVECVGRKIPFTITVKEAHSILDKFFQRYGQRALDAENNKGVDWKALSHAVRVGFQTIELLDTGIITFPRPDAKQLFQIKRGEIHFKEVSELITELNEQVQSKANTSSLPDNIDQEWVDEFIEYHYYWSVVNGDKYAPQTLPT